jgi:hypothetical protein
MSINMTATSEEGLGLTTMALQNRFKPRRARLSGGDTMSRRMPGENSKNDNIYPILPNTTPVPVINDYLNPMQCRYNPTGEDSITPSQLIPDSNVKNIQSGNTIAAQNGLTASGNSSSVPKGQPDYGTSNMQLSNVVHQRTIGTALIGSGTGNPEGPTQVTPTTATSVTDTTLVNSQSLTQLLDNNPVVSMIAAAIIFVMVGKFFK